jgi:murein DD-endopeptidase MepM/ murein hydrolase activator NlpD
MARRTAFIVLLTVGLAFAAPAAGDNSGKIANLRARAEAARQHEAALNAQISGVTRRIRSLERTAGDVSQRLSVLERDLALHQRRLERLNALFDYETQRLEELQGDYRTSVRALSRRLIEIYESRDPSTIEIVLEAKSVQDALDQIRYLKAIASQDKEITRNVAVARAQVRSQRKRTKVLRAGVASETHVIAVRTTQQRQYRAQLLANRELLAVSRSAKRHDLGKTRAAERAFIDEANALAAEDARVRARLKASQSTAPTDNVPSSKGLIWPVNGPVTSPFGMRWGRMHTGIDIGVPYGTPIHAAASGTVVLAGWEGGYGNFTCIDHGGGLATCYAHQSSIGVSVGQHVTQGQVTGAVGSTGHSFGPHLHFEVRINGTPVDPLGYL